MFKKLKQFFFRDKDTDPETAYDLWAPDYDNQPRNLMLELDEQVFSSLLKEIHLKGHSVTDIGCGSGRHWKKIMDKEPGQLTGYDVSAVMLQSLRKKFPEASVYKASGYKLTHSSDGAVQVIISTLSLAHFESLAKLFGEWNRILQTGGYILITDFHPVALQKGAKRSFRHNDRRVNVRNFIHPLPEIQKLAGRLNWQVIRLMEKEIDSTVKGLYEEQDALAAYESFRGTPIIYGMLLKKN